MEDAQPEKAWDADDLRRQLDGMAPPAQPCECHCIECGRTFSSEAIWFQRIINARAGDLDGYWMCPTPNCGGAGFTFDIFPSDPDHPANAGWHFSDDEDEDDEWSEEDDDSEISADDADDEPLDPEIEAAVQHDLEIFRRSWADDEQAIEPGDEWKLGYRPDEPVPPEVYGDAPERPDETRFNEPDRRPRVIDRSLDPPDEPRRSGPLDDRPITDDDIPF